MEWIFLVSFRSPGIQSSLFMEASQRTFEKVFPSGDIYVGNFKGLLPHGKGKYTWSDGTFYDGDWEEGKMTGKGRISWPSGTTYEGDFSGNYLHGFGTFTDSDGSIYWGGWTMNSRHGIGRKQYQNSDIYDGCWKQGRRDGSGRYSWNNGNMYIGSWKSGKMSGRGVMKWLNGDLFDGFWFNGLRHGTGCYKFVDGSYYFGTWTKGLKDGLGSSYPAGNKHLAPSKSTAEKNVVKKERLLANSSLVNSERSVRLSVKRSLSEKMSNSFPSGSSLAPRSTTSLGEDSILHDISIDVISHDSSFMLPHHSKDDQSDLLGNSAVAYKREYMQGALIKKRISSITGLSLISNQRCKFHANKVKRKSYEDNFEGYRRYYLMLNLQLGIRYTVGKITPIPTRDSKPTDFGKLARIRMYFPQKGSQFTPPHRLIDSYWKDYSPMVFRVTFASSFSFSEFWVLFLTFRNKNLVLSADRISPALRLLYRTWLQLFLHLLYQQNPYPTRRSCSPEQIIRVKFTHFSLSVSHRPRKTIQSFLHIQIVHRIVHPVSMSLEITSATPLLIEELIGSDKGMRWN